MYALLLVVHLVVCFALVAVILLQAGKGGGLTGGTLGGAAQSYFGGRGAVDFMTKATVVLGSLFFLSSLTLSLISSSSARAPRSLLQEEARRAPAQAPARPGATPPAGTVAPPAGATAPSAPPAGTAAPPAGTSPGGR